MVGKLHRGFSSSRRTKKLSSLLAFGTNKLGGSGPHTLLRPHICSYRRVLPNVTMCLNLFAKRNLFCPKGDPPPPSQGDSLLHDRRQLVVASKTPPRKNKRILTGRRPVCDATRPLSTARNTPWWAERNPLGGPSRIKTGKGPQTGSEAPTTRGGQPHALSGH